LGFLVLKPPHVSQPTLFTSQNFVYLKKLCLQDGGISSFLCCILTSNNAFCVPNTLTQFHEWFHPDGCIYCYYVQQKQMAINFLLQGAHSIPCAPFHAGLDEVQSYRRDALFKFSPVGASLVVEGLFGTCCPIGVSIFLDDHREL